MSTYPSKRDWWLMLLLRGMGVFFIYTAFTVHREPVAPWMAISATAFFSAASLLLVALCILPFYTSYSLDPQHLTIRVGPFSGRIQIADITEAYPSRNPLSAPAWSLDRVRIRFTSSWFGALISPVRQREFLAELATLAPHLQLVGDRVVRVETEQGAE